MWDSCAFPGQDLGASVEGEGTAGGAPGQARLSVMMGGARCPGLVDASDADVVEAACDALQRHMDLNLGEGARFADGVLVSRAKGAIPQYTVGHAERLRVLDGALSEASAPALVRGLVTIGNWRGGVGVADAVAQGEEMGVELARCMGAGQ